jgi:hypothetical protein
MASVQSSIRAAVSHGEFPAPEGAEAFAAYVIASGKGLIPEMEDAARQSLDHPMTFEVLGEVLRLFEGWALRDLASFRRRCRDHLVTCLDRFLENRHPGPSSIWVGCPEVNRSSKNTPSPFVLPTWLKQFLSRCQEDLKRQKFTDALNVHSRIREEYSTALQTHVSCNSCMLVHIKDGSTFCAELEDKLAQAREKVTYSPLLFNHMTRFTTDLPFVGTRRSWLSP